MCNENITSQECKKKYVWTEFFVYLISLNKLIEKHTVYILIYMRTVMPQ